MLSVQPIQKHGWYNKEWAKGRRGDNEKNDMAEIIRSYRELRVYQLAFETAMEIFVMIKKFPAEEKFSLTDQIKRSSRSVCMNLGEAWRKRRYKAAFVAKLSDSETEACETQISLEFAYKCSYISEEKFHVYYQ